MARYYQALISPLGHYLRLWSLFLLMACALSACSGKANTKPESFVGKWQSSRLETPLHIRASGEWEVKKDDGRVLQLGLWSYKDDRFTWFVKLDGKTIQDINAVVSVKSYQFQLREADQSITTFTRLE